MPQTIKYLTPTELKKFLNKINKDRDKAMFYLMYLYGMRCSEVARLTIKDLRLNDNRIFITASKNGISRENILDKTAKKLIQKYLNQRDLIIKNSKLIEDSSVLFLSRKLNKLSTTQIYRLYDYYSKKAKLPLDKQHPHCLRHSIAVHMAESGVSVERVKDHLRHRKITSTMVYFQITSKKMLENQEQDLGGEFIVKV
ncbi:MAG: tyrosine-type recombinase/integrase [Patescibacteria group bacterium]